MLHMLNKSPEVSNFGSQAWNKFSVPKAIKMKSGYIIKNRNWKKKQTNKKHPHIQKKIPTRYKLLQILYLHC